MKNCRIISTAALLPVVALVIFASCGGPGKPGGHGANHPGKGTITVTILPIKYLVDNIVGDDFEVSVLLPPGASPETYEPTPAQIEAADDANLLFFTGLLYSELALIERSAAEATVLTSATPASHHDDHRIATKVSGESCAEGEIDAEMGEIRPHYPINLSIGIDLIYSDLHNHSHSHHHHVNANSTSLTPKINSPSHGPHSLPHTHAGSTGTVQNNGRRTSEVQSREGEAPTVTPPPSPATHSSTISTTSPATRVATSSTTSSPMHSTPQPANAPSYPPAKSTCSVQGADPHIWVSPKSLRRMALSVYSAIHGLYPDSTSYTANYQRLDRRLQALDDTVTSRFARSAVRSFLIYHPGVTYFARDYGLRQIALETDGKEPSAKQLQQLIALARAQKINKILYQNEFSRNSVSIVADEIGAEPREIDILGLDIVANILKITDLITGQEYGDQDSNRDAKTPKRP